MYIYKKNVQLILNLHRGQTITISIYIYCIAKNGAFIKKITSLKTKDSLGYKFLP